MRLALSLLSIAVLAGCVGPAGPSAGTDSASTVETRPSVALLTGPIAMVDGKPVDSGAPIELSPGCHTVRTSSEFLTRPADGVTVRGTITPVNFALMMDAGQNYWVERKALNMVDTRSRVHFTLYERDGSGKVTASYAPLSESAATTFCAPAH